MRTESSAGLSAWTPARQRATAWARLRGSPRSTPQATIVNRWPFGASRDGRVLAFARGTHATVVHLGPPLRTLTLGPQYDVRHVDVSPDGGAGVVTGSAWTDPNGENAKVWEAATGKLITVLPIGPDTQPVFSADGNWLHTTNPNIHSPYWCKVGTWQPKAVPRPSGLPRGRPALACCAGYGEILLVNFETGKEMARLSIPEQTRLAPRDFSPDGAWLYASGLESRQRYRWDRGPYAVSSPSWVWTWICLLTPSRRTGRCRGRRRR